MMPLTPLNELAREIHEISTSKGFDPPDRNNINEKLLLAVGEICEAQEELRSAYGLNEVYYEHSVSALPGYDNHNFKPEGFPIEIADAIIRLLHISYSLGIDMDKMIRLKINYNKTRPEKHGRQF
jgi:NTP pyrophosphatase (non-canonical NTP hydrolase)